VLHGSFCSLCGNFSLLDDDLQGTKWSIRQEKGEAHYRE
jgi:hypothetical protein